MDPKEETMHILTKLAFTLATTLALAACSDPAPTPTPDPPEPQTTASADGHTELRDAMQAPLEKAESVEVTLQDTAAERDEALEAADD